VICDHNVFAGDLQHAIVDESRGGHNQLAQSAVK
jgi:hypothetical protein